jgi:Cu/Ag efflux pump CusA
MRAAVSLVDSAAGAANRLRTNIFLNTGFINIEFVGGWLSNRKSIMATSITSLGLTRLLILTGVGIEVRYPLVDVVVFGLTSSSFFTRFALPSFNELVEQRIEKKLSN